MIDTDFRTVGSVMTEAGFRTIGGLLQLVGVLLVAYELHAAIARYRGEPNVVDRFRGSLVRLRTRIVREWRRLRRTGTDMSEALNVPIVSDVGITDEMIPSLGPRDHSSFESDAERIEYLFRRDKDTNARIDRLGDDLERAKKEYRQGQLQLDNQVRDTNEAIRHTAQAIEAGSVRLRTTGFMCVMSGTVFATWSPDLAKTRLGLPLMLVATLWGLSFAWTRQPSSRSALD